MFNVTAVAVPCVSMRANIREHIQFSRAVGWVVKEEQQTGRQTQREAETDTKEKTHRGKDRQRDKRKKKQRDRKGQICREIERQKRTTCREIERQIHRETQQRDPLHKVADPPLWRASPVLLPPPEGSCHRRKTPALRGSEATFVAPKKTSQQISCVLKRNVGGA